MPWIDSSNGGHQQAPKPGHWWVLFSTSRLETPSTSILYRTPLTWDSVVTCAGIYHVTLPIGSMLYDIIAYIYHKYHPNVGKYTSHMGPFWKLLQLFDEKLVFCGTQMRVSLEGRASGLSCWYLMLMAEIRRSPVDGKVVEIPLFTRSSLPSQVVVWDFWTINSRNWITSPLYRYCTLGTSR